MLELKQLISTSEREYLNDITNITSDKIYKINLQKVIEERCDELNYLLDDENYEILHREMKRVATSIYNYTVYFY